jgi:hypothetical protein
VAAGHGEPASFLHHVGSFFFYGCFLRCLRRLETSLSKSPDELFETISQALMAAMDRDALSGNGVIVHLM